MGNPVFANGMEISSKSMSGKSICEFPDVCFTPPQTPATPPGVPLPYPNTAMAGDTSDGSSTVTIGGQEVMLKNKSYFRQSTGDEAGCAPKKGMISSTIKGKCYFIAWSMDVKVEGENVVRNLDMTTHNHGSTANGAVPTVHAAKAGMKDLKLCDDEKTKIDDNCTDDKEKQCPGVLSKSVSQQRAQFDKVPSKRLDAVKKYASLVDEGESRTVNAANVATAQAESSDCVKAMRCWLRPFKPKEGETGCCPGQTAHHIPPKSCMRQPNGKYPANYTVSGALCVCMEGAGHSVGSHGENHSAINYFAGKASPPMAPGDTCTPAQYNKVCANAVAAQCGCSPGCIEEQLNKSMEDLPKNTKVTHDKIGTDVSQAKGESLSNALKTFKKKKSLG